MVGKGVHFKLFCEGKTCCKTQGCGSDPANVMYKSSIATSGYFSIIKYHSLATRARSPQQHELITAGPYYLSHPVNFSCGGKPEYTEKTHDFQLSDDYTFSHEDWVQVHLTGDRTQNLIGERGVV